MFFASEPTSAALLEICDWKFFAAVTSAWAAFAAATSPSAPLSSRLRANIRPPAAQATAAAAANQRVFCDQTCWRTFASGSRLTFTTDNPRPWSARPYATPKDTMCCEKSADAGPSTAMRSK